MPALEDKVRLALQQVYDPEIPVNISDLGLIYEITQYPINNIYIQMTATTPHCPAAIFLPEQVRAAAQGVEGVNDVHVELVYEPAWSKDRMSAAARKALGYK
jgi:FeS assembly SUF system protein